MPFHAIPLLLALAIPLNPSSFQAPQPSPTLASMRDRYRPVLIFAPKSDPRLIEQTRLLTAHHTELLERQVMLVPFFHAYAGQVDPEVVTLLAAEETALRERFHVQPSEFTVVLIGKDGGEKFRSSTLVTMRRLCQIIDAMPMRQQEMRSRPSP